MAISPVTSGLVLDLQADALGLTNGATVSTWTDQSAAANNGNATAGTPTYATGITPTGGPAIHFNNTGYYVFTNNAIFNSATTAEVFFVLRANGAGNTGHYQFGGNDFTFYPFSDGNCYDGSFTNGRTSWASVSPTSWHIYNVSHDGTTWTLRIDGTITKTVTIGFTTPGASPKTTLAVGWGPGSSSGKWIGDIAETVAYTRSLNSTERTQVYNFLYGRHIVAPTPGAVSGTFSMEMTAAGTLTVPKPLAASVSMAMTTHGTLSVFVPVVPVDAPPATSEVVCGATAPFTINTPPALAKFGTPVPSWVRIQRIPIEPENTAVVPNLRPTFVLDVTVIDGTVYTLSVDVQYADNAFFTFATTLSVDVDQVVGVNVVRVATTIDLDPDATYSWRARVIADDVVLPWTDAFTFTVDPTIGDATAPIRWDVTTADTDPTIWYITPTSGPVGTTVIVVGRGFSVLTGTVTVDGTPLTILDWTTDVAATSAASTDARTIDFDLDLVDCEHDEITVEIPALPGGIGSLVVTDGS